DARRAVAILQNFADSAELAEAHYIVGITLCSQGDYAAAIEPLKQAIAVSISALGLAQLRAAPLAASALAGLVGRGDGLRDDGRGDRRHRLAGAQGPPRSAARGGRAGLHGRPVPHQQ
ncbi:hypothetical protein, partial [Hydrocarboniphaga sp.]|uniref:hypothetical protein n=1 Tax=Hydrocarboniphaga sp. TaxID=2033016 RepID=UPI002ABABF6A